MSLLRRMCGIVLSRALPGAGQMLGEIAARMSALVGIAGVVAVLGIAPLPAEAGSKRKPNVLILYAPGTTGPADVQTRLIKSGEFATVSLLETTVVPAISFLNGFDAILMYNEGARFSPVGETLLGDNLADYVDAGGGVVSMGCATTVQLMPQGRFYSDYSVLNLTNASLNPSTLDAASITDPNHAILIGVQTLAAGNLNFHSASTTVRAGATIVAKWADGAVLVAAGPRPGRVDLNMGGVSSSVISQGWDVTTDGVKLMVNSLLYVMRPRVLLVAADGQAAIEDVKSKLMTADANGVGPVVGQIDQFGATLFTPTLAKLQQYDAVLVWSLSNFADPIALGNVLADYVDVGGGVVIAPSTNTTTQNLSRLAGRWVTGGYEIIPGGGGQTIGTPATFATGIPNHPVRIGATGFSGGSLSIRPATLLVKPFCLKVANWSDGKTLAAASSKFPNRLDLGFYPPSISIGPGYWPVAAHGEKLMGAALLYVSKPYIACVSADTQYSIDVRAKLAASRRFSGVLGIDVSPTGATPTIITLTAVSAVLMWSNENLSDRTAMGNVLADYVAAGGGSVTAVFGNTSSPLPMQGRWTTDGHEIVPEPSTNAQQGGGPVLGDGPESDHPIAQFVRHLSGGAGWRLSGDPLLRGRTILKWSDGAMLASVHTFRKRADLGMFPPSNGIFATGWNQRTDGTWLMANALEWVSRSKPCPGDFNGDGVVDDADFTLFVGYYNTLLDPRGDLTGNGTTEDADFSKFVAGYNDLVCP